MRLQNIKNDPDEAKKYLGKLKRLNKLPIDLKKVKTSKVLLLSLPGLNTGSDPLFPLGIGYLLAAIRKDRPAQAVHYQVFEHAIQQLPEIISFFQPEIVGMTCSTFNRGNVRKICVWLHKHHPHIKIILGGVHVSFFAEQALRDYGADFVVIGEGELTFRDLCNALDKDMPLASIKGIAFRDGEQIVITESREVVRNLDDLPLPDYSYAGDLMRRSGIGYVITSRGCPARCHFCSTGSYWGQRVRVNSPRRVVDEIEALIKNYGVKKIFFHDDTFNLNLKRVGEICDEISARKLNVEWGVSCRVHPVSQEMIDRMVAAGCRHICWGIESGSAQMLARMNKKITQEQISRAYELCRMHLGTISVGAFTIVGNPGESEMTIAESVSFINTLPMTDPPSTSILCILPGTQLYKEVSEKHLVNDRYWAENDGVPQYTFEHPLDRLRQWTYVVSQSGNLLSFDRNHHFWNNVLFGNIPGPSVPVLSFLDSELNHVIPPEIKEDAFYYLIQELARTEKVSTVLEIGSSAGAGSTEAFVKGLSENHHGAPQLFCMEVSQPRYAELARRYANKPFVHCYNTSSVPLTGFPSPKQVEAFYHATKTSLNNYPLERVLGWLTQDIDYVRCADVDEDGIERIKRENDIDCFDMVLIDGSEFTGKYELEKVYGARIILLDDINGFKNYDNYQRLAADKTYQLVTENWKVRNGYAAFRRIEDPFPIHFFTIVLNGEPFIRHHIDIFRQLPFKWHWHIIEGVADLKHDTGWSLKLGGKITDELHHNGLSNDGTTEYLDKLAERFPEKITIYRKNDGKFWDGKLEMVNVPLVNIREKCLLWQVDADELWTADQISAMINMFKLDPHRTSSYFYCYYFVGPKKYVSSINTWATYPNDWIRVWNYKPGMRWGAHEPPVLVDEQGINVGLVNPFTRDETMSRDITFQHFAYVKEAQVRFKEIYYGYANAVSHWRKLQKTVGPVNPAMYFPWAKNDAVVDQWPKDNEPLLSELCLSSQHQSKDYSSMSVDSGTLFEKELRQLFKSIRPATIIETGTYMGQGTSSIIWRALHDFAIDADFTTIEVNPVHHDIAQRHFQQHDMRIHAELGLTLPRKLLPCTEEIAEKFVHQKEYDNIYYDHNETVRARLYFTETDYNVSDSMLYKVMERYNFKPSFVLLDSAGHLGFAEFQYFLSLVKGDCHLMLDDIYHCKHYKTLKAIKADARFQILVESPEKFGFCIAKYTHVKSLLFFRPDSIGDNVMAASMLPHIKAKYSDAKISVLCQDHITELYESSPFVDSVIGFNRLKGYQDETYRNSIVQQLQALRAELLLNSLYSRDPLYDLFAINSGACISVAFNGNLCNISSDERDKNNKLYTRIIPDNEQPKREIERHRDFLTAIGIDAPPLQPVVWTTPDDEMFADVFFSKNRLDSEKTIALFVCGQWIGKFYEHYESALSKILKDKDMSVIALGTDSASEINQKIVDHIGVTAINLAGKTTLRQTAAILKRCRLVIGADTGLAHIACAVGTSNVVILGGGHFGRFMPYSPLTSIVCLPLECYDCNWQCRYERPYCIKGIKAEVITEAFRQTLNKKSDKPRLFVQGTSLWISDLQKPRWRWFDEYYIDINTVDIISCGTVPPRQGVTNELYSKCQGRVISGDIAGAVNDLERLLEASPDHALAHNDLGVLYFRLGDKEKAQKHYEAAVMAQSGNLTFIKNLAGFYHIVQKDTEKALQLYIKGLSINPNDVEILSALGRISFENNRKDEAIYFFTQVRCINPLNEEVGRILQIINDHADREIISSHDALSENVKKNLGMMRNSAQNADAPYQTEAYTGTDDHSHQLLVTALVSTYNSERFLRGCLEDLEAQTIADKVEIIVIDSCSLQNERAIVEEFQKRFRNIVYLRTPKREKLYAAWNRGIRMARGKYITNTNTDDRRLPNALEIEARALEMFPDVGLVYADIWETSIENDTLNPNDTKRFKLHSYPDFTLLNGLTGSNFSPQPMWRASAHDRVGFFDESYTIAGDYEFFYRLSRSFNALHIRAPLGLYLANTSGIEKSQPQLTGEEFHRLRLKFYSEITLNEFFPGLAARREDNTAHGLALLELGNNCMRSTIMQECGLATKYYLQARPLLNDMPQLLHNLGIARINAGDKREGIEFLRKAAVSIPLSAEALKKIEQNRIPTNDMKIFTLGHPVISDARRGRSIDLDSLSASGKLSNPITQPNSSLQNRTTTESKGLTSIIIMMPDDIWNLKQCIASIQKNVGEPYEIIIAYDKAKNKDSRKLIRTITQDNPHYQFVEGGSTSEYAKSINKGLQASSGEYIVVMSADVVVAQEWLSGMMECLHKSSTTGIVGPMSNDARFAQHVISEDFLDSNQLPSFAIKFREHNRHRRITVKTLDGFCILFRHSLVLEIGLFDEQYGLNGYMFDDFCLRSTLKGHQNFIAADVIVYNYGKTTNMPRTKSIFTGKWTGLSTQKDILAQMDAIAVLEKAEILIHQGKIDAAFDLLIGGIGFHPEVKKIYYALSSMLVDAKRFQEAYDVMCEMPSDEHDVKKLEIMAFCKEGLGLYKEAEEQADAILLLNAQSAPALNIKGVIAYKRRDLSTAENFFQQAIAADPGYGVPYTNIGVMRWTADNREEALNLFEKGFILSPTTSDLTSRYYEAVSVQKEYNRAERSLRDAIRIYPNHKKIFFLLIDSLIKQEQFTEAMREIQEVLVTFDLDDGLLSAALAVRARVGPKIIDKTVHNRASLSLCMIVKNEEQYLPRCLHSIAPVVDEMIIVDTGSTDRTKNIAVAYGAKLYDFSWNDDFSEARNASLAKASGDWIFVLDADELVSPLDYPALENILRKKKAVRTGYSLITRNYTEVFGVEGWSANEGKYEREAAGNGWLPSKKVRLFPNDPRIRFENPVHELVETSIKRLGFKIELIDIPVHHLGRLNQKKLAVKQEHYYSLGVKKLEETSGDMKAVMELAIQAGELGKYEEAIALWKRVIEVNPKESLAYYNIGGQHLINGNYHDALQASKKAVTLAPDRKEAVTNYAFCEILVGDIQNARLFLSELMKKNADFPIALALLGAVNCIEGNNQKGFEYFEKLLKIRISFLSLIHNTAERLLDVGRAAQAVKLLNAVIDGKYANRDILILQKEALKMAQTVGAGTCSQPA
jgi:radical SAM superfamily enzyme YgiQ (UPF0313 family)/glycosyltransferase involved in cell wall biosynthesis/ADP-heptose:LPS heptosyltransferase/predicted O-methyltransferase YrrM